MRKGPDFFAVERWPTARFEARGRLTLRDVTREIALPLRLETAADGRTATPSGSAATRPLEFGVGQGEWRDTQCLSNEVEARFELALSIATKP